MGWKLAYTSVSFRVAKFNSIQKLFLTFRYVPIAGPRIRVNLAFDFLGQARSRHWNPKVIFSGCPAPESPN
jgi:hypothetical protein